MLSSLGLAARAIECPLCGPRPGRLWTRQAGFTVYRCRGCRLLITWPRPTEKQLAQRYDAAYYERKDMGSSAGPHWLERAAEIVRFSGVSARTALDFGAGQGHFVSALRELGLAAQGVEPSDAAREQARAQHGVALLERLPAGARFDLITLVHTLEHLPAPVATLRALKECLAAGGAVFIEVPNAETVELWRPSWRDQLLSLPEHLFHFTPESLQAVVERAGLRVVRTRVADAFVLAWLYRQWTRLRPRAIPQPASREEPGGPAPPCPGPVTASAPAGLGRRLALAAGRWLPGWKIQLVATAD